MLVVAAPIYFNMGGQPLKEHLGLKQYDILFTAEQMAASTQYLDLSSKYSTRIAKKLLFENSGIYEGETNGKPSFDKCGKYIYPRYNYKEKNCEVDFRSSFENYVENTLKIYKDAYEINLKSSFNVDVITNKEDSNIKANSPEVDFSLSNLKIPIESKADFDYEKKKYYPTGIFGTLGNEKMITCSTGDCFSQAASYFYDLYDLAGLKLKYINEGSSPYTYKESVKSDFFNEVKLYSVEPETNKFTDPGFDGAGFAWWVGEHTRAPFFKYRKTTQEYYEDAINEQVPVCEKDKCTKEFVADNALPGDIIFVYEKDALPTHMLIYVGGDTVIHSKPNEGLVKESLSENFYDKEDKTSIVAIYRLSFDENGKKNLPGYGEREEGEERDCVVQMDFSQINEDALRSGKKPGDITELMSLLEKYDEEYNVLTAISEASSKYPRISKEFILAIINTETGVNFGTKYLEGSGVPCNDKGYCGLMQVGKTACDSVDKKPDVKCDYKSLQNRDFEMGIIAGTAHLENLMSYNNIINPSNPNLYFLSLAYNAGIGSLKYILEEAAKNTKKENILDVEWSDVTFDDVVAGMKKVANGKCTGVCDGFTGENINGCHWACSKDKWEEIFEYPNKVALSLEQQCDGTLFAGAKSKLNSYIKTDLEFQTTSSINFDELEEINRFVDALKFTCKDKLDVCVSEAIEQFSANPTSVTEELGIFNINNLGGEADKNTEDYTSSSNYLSPMIVPETSPTTTASIIKNKNYEFLLTQPPLPKVPRSTITITRNQEKDSLALDLAEQIIDCRNNDQVNCTCSFDINYNLRNKYEGDEENYAIKFENSGNVRVGESKMSGQKLNPETSKFLFRLPFNPVKFYVKEDMVVSSDVKVGVMGSSSTVLTPTNYVKKLDDESIGTFVSYGVSGQSTTKMLARFKTDILGKGYDDVIIFAGVNDLPTTDMEMTKAKANLQKMYDLAHENKMRVIALTIQPTKGATAKFWTGEPGREPEKVIEKTKTLNNWIRTEAKNVDIVIDAFKLLEDPINPNAQLPEYATADKLHFNAKGHEALAKLIYEEAYEKYSESSGGSSSDDALFAGFLNKKSLIIKVDIKNKKINFIVEGIKPLSVGIKPKCVDSEGKTIDCEDDSEKYDFDKLAMAKLKGETKWIPYQSGYPQLECKNNKKNFRFQAYLPQMGKTINFSVYLNDTIAPYLTLLEPEYSKCFKEIVPILKWEVDANDNFIDRFNIILQEKKADPEIFIEKTYYVRDSKEIKNVREADEFGRLYKIKNGNKITYLTKFVQYRSLHPTNDYFKAGEKYNYSINAIDAYGNENKQIDEFQISLLIDKLAIPDMKCDTHILKSTTLENLYGKSQFELNLREYGTWEGYGKTNEIKNPDGNPMFWIEGIPNVVCDESTTKGAGLVCAGTKELLEKLNELSQTYLVPMGLELRISQAYRTYDIQKYFWDQWLDKKGNKACNPHEKSDPYPCPHMVAGAIDIHLYDLNDNGRPFNTPDDYLFQEEMLCDIGFIRFGGERWHFEYRPEYWKAKYDANGKLAPNNCFYSKSKDVLAPYRSNYKSKLKEWLLAQNPSVEKTTTTEGETT